MNAKKASRRRKNPRIEIARTRADIRRCFPVMRELRPHFTNAAKFIEQVSRQQRDGYLLAFVEEGGEVRGVAGYRFLESLFSGKFLYVDDLVTRDRDRSRGFGAALLTWLIGQARKRGCVQLELDSGVQRFDAHRFYLVNRMKIASHHFSIVTGDGGSTKKRKRN
jgi:GNAT superfamily N-acetyltransferase